MKILVDKLKHKLAKTKNGFVAKIAETLKLRTKIDQNLLEDIEDILIESDIGLDVSETIIEKMSEEIRIRRIEDPAMIMDLLKEIISGILGESEQTESIYSSRRSPQVFLIVGVNGVGKTTTIGKLANNFRKEKKKVMMIAGDTFRAAAIEQLTIWSERAKAFIHKHQAGSDPSAVVYDGLNSAVNKKVDVVLIDTAGRLHNKVNLMNELSKINRTIKKIIPDAPHQTLLVLDASTGQNAITQAKIFNDIVAVDGIALTKLDGTAKGGIVISIKKELNIPVKLIGLGEGIDDLRDFDSEDFAEALFA